MKTLMMCFVMMVAAMPFSAIAADAPDAKPPYYLTDAELDKSLGVNAETKTPATFVWVVYFHREPGCATCQLMSKMTHETVRTHFADTVKERQIVLRYQNFEDAKNAELVKKLKVKSPSLAVIVVRDGKIVKAKIADQIWALAADKEKFTDYVRKEIDVYHRETVPPPPPHK
ncbi:MAG: nitrophenyl compound nitroreductase subunit ArsF family protein [Thermoguttaceae bacterium]